MKYLNFRLSPTVALAPVCLASSAFMSFVEAKNNITPKPNFVVILIDDLGYGDIGPFGATTQKTPNLDKMAAEGMKMTSFYACPISSPARMSIMTGCYPIRSGMPEGVFMPADHKGMNPYELTVAELLKGQGYKTACIGKWHLGDAPEFMPTNNGFDTYYGLPYSNDMAGKDDGGKTQYEGTGDPRMNEPMPPLPLMKGDKVLKTVKTADQEALLADYTTESIRFIHENRNRPFFLYLAHNAVHVPFHPSHKFRGRTGNGKVADWIEEMDWSVGEVLAALQKEGIAENTLVLFTSDNGSPYPKGGRSQKGASNFPLRGVKHTVYEGGLRVPTIAWWPGKIQPATSCKEISSTMDILPTFVELAGGTLPTDRKIDGGNLFPLLSGAIGAKSPHSYYDYYLNDDLCAIREGDWKLHRKEESGKLLEKPELYNLAIDIGEKINLATEHPEIVARLEQLAQSEAKELGDGKPGPACRKSGFVENPKTIIPSNYQPYQKVKPRPSGTAPNDLKWLANQNKMVTGEIQRTIDACAKNGGGTILFGAGTYVMAPITLRDGVTLQLDSATLLLGSAYPDDYHKNGSYGGLILANNAKHFSIKGKGTIDGNRIAFEQLLPGVSIGGKPSCLLQFNSCSDFTLEGVNLKAINGSIFGFDDCSGGIIKEVKVGSR